MSAAAQRVFWTPPSKVLHTGRSTCWRRYGEHTHSDYAVMAPSLLAKGMRLCAACGAVK